MTRSSAWPTTDRACAWPCCSRSLREWPKDYKIPTLRQSGNNPAACTLECTVAPSRRFCREITMKISIVGGLILSAALATSALAAPATNYKIVDRIKVPDGGFDYATFDAATGNVLMARTDFTTVIDTKTGKVSDLKSPNHGHIALPVPGTPLLILTQRAGTVRIVDKTKDSVVADLLVGKNPDGATYDPLTKMVFVMNHDDGNSTVVDVAAKRSVATIKVGGELEFPVSDGAGHVFVNVADVPEIAVIDVRTKQVAGRYKLNGCMDASGLAYIADSKLLISACANEMA